MKAFSSFYVPPTNLFKLNPRIAKPIRKGGPIVV
jgi:hypothetical protein